MDHHPEVGRIYVQFITHIFGTHPLDCFQFEDQCLFLGQFGDTILYGQSQFLILKDIVAILAKRVGYLLLQPIAFGIRIGAVVDAYLGLALF